MGEMGLSLDDDAVRFITCPGDSPCCSFTATESHAFFGYTNGRVTAHRLDSCSGELECVADATTVLPAGSSEVGSGVAKCNADISRMIDCLCPCLYSSVDKILLSVLHGHDVVTFVTFSTADSSDSGHFGFRVERSVSLHAAGDPLQYTNRATAHCWLDGDTFLVGCLDGVVLAVSASVNASHRVVLKEQSPIVQIAWDAVSSFLVVSSVQRSVVATYANASLSVKPIGTKPREEGVLGACIWPISHAVYAARHNTRIFECAVSSGVVARTFRIPPEAGLGAMKPLLIASSSLAVTTHNGVVQSSPPPVLLWSEGPRFVSILVLATTDTHHVTRRFFNTAVVCSAILSSSALVLCSDGKLMYVPLVRYKFPTRVPRLHASDELLERSRSEQLSAADTESRSVHHHRRVVKKKVFLIVRRRKVSRIGEVLHASECCSPVLDPVIPAPEPPLVDDDRTHSGGLAIIPRSFSAHSDTSLTCERGTVVTSTAGGVDEVDKLHKKDDVPREICPRVVCEKVFIPKEREASFCRNDNSVEAGNKVKRNTGESGMSRSSYRRFRVEMDHLIRLFNVHALHVGEHSQLYAAVQEFLPLLEEQLIQSRLLSWSSHLVPHLGEITNSCGGRHQTANDTRKIVDGNFLFEEEATVSALRNVLKSALAWSVKHEVGEGELPWMKTAILLHLLLAIPWPACSIASLRGLSEPIPGESGHLQLRLTEECWLEEAGAIEQTVERCGVDDRYLPLVLALSNYVVSSLQAPPSSSTTPMRLSVLLNGHERCAVILANLQAARRTSVECQQSRAMELQLENIIVEQSPHILDALDDVPYPNCAFYAYFPYVFATFPSKAISLALQHYPGTSLAYFEWALSSTVQSMAFQTLRDAGSVVAPLSLEDLADGIADLVLALYEASGLKLCESPADYLTCLRILLQRRFSLLRWMMRAEQERLQRMTERGDDATSGSYGSCYGRGRSLAVSAPLFRRKLQRLEGGLYGLLQGVPSVMDAFAGTPVVAAVAAKDRVALHEDMKHRVLNLLEEYEFPEGVAALSWTREFIAHCMAKNRVERLLPLFQLPRSTNNDSEWVFLFRLAYESGTLEVAMLFCLTVERVPERVRQLLQRAFASRAASVEAAHGDEQLERVTMKLGMLT
ncbi:hypothetical protein DQ04_00191230 [Trypanosoma grayi]|uniref:hypothetical protein n=1 Tax=Trypanosoma grayi TaxID=71804 RepID=UPI0004F4857A|nr:hypothetical protein DQ04_00191230 [Trypanosoma grayi]KEG15099.1 hypothetical protein DQ04_00191230 [Trypanosoma grayi]